MRRPCAGPQTPATITNGDTLVGWTIGGGIEAALTRNWLLRGEYRYADYGTQSYTVAGNFGVTPVVST